MPRRILVIGKNGQLGSSIAKIAQNYPQYDMTFVGRDELDLIQSQTITEYFQDKTFHVIINCAAYTAVDKAESESELANQVNHLAVKQLAHVAKDKNAILVHISTDYVFNGQNYKPYVETDPVDPINIYGKTKLKGEQAIHAIKPKGMVIRTSWLYSEFGNNFVKTMLRLGKEKRSLDVVFDQVGGPTYAVDLARGILDTLSLPFHPSEQSVRIFHYSNEGVCSWYDFAKTIFELSNIHCQVNPIEIKDYPAPAERPHYSVLNNRKIKQRHLLAVPYWKHSLGVCLNELVKI